MAGIDGKVKSFADNILTLKDIRTNPALWRKPTDVNPRTGEPSYRDLRIYTEWPYWTKNYNFLPLPSKWKEIKERVFKDLYKKRTGTQTGEHTGDKWTTENQKTDQYPQINYYIIKNANATLTFIFQNKKRLSLEKPNLALFFGNYNPAKKDIPSLYWITNHQYIDDRKLYVQIEAKKCLFWEYFGHFAKSWGTANIKKSTIGFTHNDHADDNEGVVGNKTSEWQLANPKGVMSCEACLACFDFCGSNYFGDKKKEPGREPGTQGKRPKYPTWQPKWKIGWTNPEISKILDWGDSMIVQYNEIKDEETGEIMLKVPTNIQLHVMDSDFIHRVRDILSDKPTLLFLVDYNHPQRRLIGGSEVWNAYNKVYLDELPDCYNKQSHMLNHSTVQCYFLKKIVLEANLRHVKVRKINGRLNLVYKVRARSNIGGVHYLIETGEILAKFDVKVTGNIQQQGNLLDNLIDGLFSAITKPIREADLGSLDAGGFMGLGIGSFFKMIKMAVKGWIKKQCGTNINELLTGEKYNKMLGLADKKSEDKEKPTTGKQVDLKSKSTNKAKPKEVESSVKNADTTLFNYNLWEFANRVEGYPFQIYYQHSNQHFDLLTNNTNKAPVQNIHARFNKFQQCLKEGPWQGDVSTYFDTPDFFFANILKKGVVFYSDWKKIDRAGLENPPDLFTPWKWNREIMQSFTFDTKNNATGPAGQEEIEKIPGGEKETGSSTSNDPVSTDTTAFYVSTRTYCKGPDGDIAPQLIGLLAGNFKSDHKENDSSYWYFWADRDDSAEMDVTEGTYDFQVWGYGGRRGQDERGKKANRIRITLKGEELTFTTIEVTEGSTSFRFKGEIDDEKQEDLIVVQDYDNPSMTDTGTEFDTELDLDNDDDRDDADVDDFDYDPDGDEKEADDDIDFDPDKDEDKDKDKDRDDDIDDDIEVDNDQDDDFDDDFEDDPDDDKEPDEDGDDETDPDDDKGDGDDDQDREGG